MVLEKGFTGDLSQVRHGNARRRDGGASIEVRGGHGGKPFRRPGDSTVVTRRKYR